MISVKNLLFHYNKVFRLSVPELKFDTGTSYAIIGRNGSGKSTLLKILAGIIRNYRGEISLNNINLSKLNIQSLRRLISYCSAEPPLNENFRLEEYVEMGFFILADFLGRLPKDARERKEYLLHFFNLASLRKKHLFELSSGELKLAQICKAVAVDAEVVLLDEPEQHLDLHNVHKLFNFVKNEYTARGKTVIFTTHNINLASKFSEKMLILEQGSILYYGDTQKGINAENIERIYGYRGEVFIWKDERKRFVY